MATAGALTCKNLLCYHSKYIWIMSPIFISQHDIKIEILQIILSLKEITSIDANFVIVQIF